LSLWSRQRLEKPLNKNKKTESSQCQPFVQLLHQLDKPAEQQKKQSSKDRDANGWQLLCQNQKKYKAEKQRGDALLTLFCLTSSILLPLQMTPNKETKKSQCQCQWFDC